MSTNATWKQAGHTLTLIDDQGLDLEQTNMFHLYLPVLAAGVKAGTLPDLEMFRAVCQGRVNPELLEPRWTEKDGVIYLTLLSNGFTGPQWKDHFRQRGTELSKNAQAALDSPDFQASKAGTIKHIAIIKGETFADDKRITRVIHAKAVDLKFTTLDMESICLIRDTFSNKEINAMGLRWIVGMHDPVTIDGAPLLLTADARGYDPWLFTDFGNPVDRWTREDGFAFFAPQVLKA